MIYVGTDIVEIARINKLIMNKGYHFLSHVFTEIEQTICNAKISPHIHYGGKFAAKEAVKKAILAYDTTMNISIKSIEINNNSDGGPEIVLNNRIIRSKSFQVSISHTNDYAIATAILEII